MKNSLHEMASTESENRKQFHATVVENVDLSPVNPDHFRLTLDCSDIVRNIKPGQFLHILPPGNLDLLRRPISIMDVNQESGHVEILMRVIGEGTKLIANCQNGDTLDILGPLGNGYEIFTDRSAVLVGGGVGIPPLVYLAKTLVKSGIVVKILLGARDLETLICEGDFRELGLTPWVTTEDGSVGTKGFVTQLIDNVQEFPNPVVYACGPIPMLNTVYGKSVELGWSDCFVSLENKLGCGIGACLGCSVPVSDDGKDIFYERVCTEGPVFNASRVIFEKM